MIENEPGSARIFPTILIDIHDFDGIEIPKTIVSLLNYLLHYVSIIS